MCCFCFWCALLAVLNSALGRRHVLKNLRRRILTSATSVGPKENCMSAVAGKTLVVVSVTSCFRAKAALLWKSEGMSHLKSVASQETHRRGPLACLTSTEQTLCYCEHIPQKRSVHLKGKENHSETVSKGDQRDICSINPLNSSEFLCRDHGVKCFFLLPPV